jgi:hypothetical protein
VTVGIAVKQRVDKQTILKSISGYGQWDSNCSVNR